MDIAMIIVAAAVVILTAMITIDSMRVAEQRAWLEQMIGHVRELASSQSDASGVGE
jgi:hypothetical protein